MEVGEAFVSLSSPPQTACSSRRSLHKCKRWSFGGSGPSRYSHTYAEPVSLRSTGQKSSSSAVHEAIARWQLQLEDGGCGGMIAAHGSPRLWTARKRPSQNASNACANAGPKRESERRQVLYGRHVQISSFWRTRPRLVLVWGGGLGGGGDLRPRDLGGHPDLQPLQPGGQPFGSLAAPRVDFAMFLLWGGRGGRLGEKGAGEVGGLSFLVCEELDRSIWGFTSVASAVWLFKRENVRAAHLDGLLFPFGPQTGNP